MTGSSLLLAFGASELDAFIGVRFRTCLQSRPTLPIRYGHDIHFLFHTERLLVRLDVLDDILDRAHLDTFLLSKG
jgi:hypothetical protein